MRRIGPAYDLFDGVRIQDVGGACHQCGKRLAEVIHDPRCEWRTGVLVCIDCATIDENTPRHRVDIKPYFRGGGKWIAFCSCGHSSIAGNLDKTKTWAREHRAQAWGAA